MVTAMAKYFLQQGYISKDVTILTPYLGQLALIRSHLKSMDLGKGKKNRLIENR